eukprot:s1300_g6.t1
MAASRLVRLSCTRTGAFARTVCWNFTARPRCSTAMGGLLRTPPTATPAITPCARRNYLDSMDRTVTVYGITDPLEDSCFTGLLDFMDKNSDSDLRTFEAALRTLGRISAGPAYKQVVGDGRFHAILSTLATRLEDCDATMLSKISDATARFRTSTPELNDLAQRRHVGFSLCQVVCQREDMFSPRNLANIAIALALRGVRDVPTVEFVRNEAIKLMDDMEPQHCNLLLEEYSPPPFWKHFGDLNTGATTNTTGFWICGPAYYSIAM